MNVAGCGLARHEGADQQRGVDAGVGERGPLQAREGAAARQPARSRGAHIDSQRAIRGRRLAGLGRPVLDLARPPGELVVLVIRSDPLLVPLGQPCLADEHDEPLGQAQQRLAADALGRDRPLLLELADERVGGALAEIDRAAGAERPAPGPRGDPRRPAPGQPAAVGRRGSRTARRSLWEASPSTSRSAQRSGCSSISMPRSSCS